MHCEGMVIFLGYNNNYMVIYYIAGFHGEPHSQMRASFSKKSDFFTSEDISIPHLYIIAKVTRELLHIKTISPSGPIEV